ncbi:hypothetical protein BJ165DRAFT_1581052 [Panaeolus papilionaceus]|nr:hypothetical protein BJ165DRAFT_1581052 [Panaeolus papilionaceus]
MLLPKLQTLHINGDISVEPVTGCIPNDPYPTLYLIMGPTGAGKSSFIEALAGESQQLSISKNQLAGYTQTVNAYRLMNVVSTIMSTTHPVYLIDTPGFSDSKISTIEIMDMVKKWLKENDLEYVDGILFLTPITDTRLPGSRRKTIAMLQQLLAPTHNLGSVIFVTTMWDALHNEHTRKRAESNFEQLRDGICKEFFEEQRFKERRFEGQSVSITRFMNTKSSALEAMDPVWDIVGSFSQSEMSASPNLYRDLHERIEGGLQAKQMIELELAQPEAQTNSELRTIFEKNQRENDETLTKFIAQLANFRSIPKGLEGAHQRLQASIEAMHRAPPPTFLQPPAIPANEPAAVVAIASSSVRYATIFRGDDGVPARAPLLSEGNPFILSLPPSTNHVLHQ